MTDNWKDKKKSIKREKKNSRKKKQIGGETMINQEILLKNKRKARIQRSMLRGKEKEKNVKRKTSMIQFQTEEDIQLMVHRTRKGMKPSRGEEKLLMAPQIVNIPLMCLIGSTPPNPSTTVSMIEEKKILIPNGRENLPRQPRKSMATVITAVTERATMAAIKIAMGIGITVMGIMDIANILWRGENLVTQSAAVFHLIVDTMTLKGDILRLKRKLKPLLRRGERTEKMITGIPTLKLQETKRRILQKCFLKSSLRGDETQLIRKWSGRRILTKITTWISLKEVWRWVTALFLKLLRWMMSLKNARRNSLLKNAEKSVKRGKSA